MCSGDPTVINNFHTKIMYDKKIIISKNQVIV